MIVDNAKFLSWMSSFCDLERQKPTRKKAFQWMEEEIIPFWTGVVGQPLT